MENTFEYLLPEMGLSEEQQTKVVISFITGMTYMTDEDVSEIAKQFSANIPKELAFLKGKINYELAALGIIMDAGIKNNDLGIKLAVKSLKKERGYI